MNDSGEFSEQDFEQCFKEFDKDGSGTIEKDEMAIFIKKVAGLWTTEQISAESMQLEVESDWSSIGPAHHEETEPLSQF